MLQQREWIALAAMAVLALAAGDGSARTEGSTATHGCDRLARLVTETVVAAFSANSFRQTIGEVVETPLIVSCDRTTATVTAAFVDGMQMAGADVGWRWPGGGPGDVCLSGFLDQCYPERGHWGAGDPALSAAAGRAWLAVRETISRAMPLGVASDQSVFAAGLMQQALVSALEQSAR